MHTRQSAGPRIKRREFCQLLLAGALPLGGAKASAEPASAGDVRPLLYKIIYDSRFRAARSYAAAAAREGLVVTGFDGDPTALWLRDIGPHWAADGAGVAGMTTERTLLCLEQMAHGVWRRVRVRENYRATAATGPSARGLQLEPPNERLVSWIIDS